MRLSDGPGLPLTTNHEFQPMLGTSALLALLICGIGHVVCQTVSFAKSDGAPICGPASINTLLNIATLVSALFCAVTQSPMSAFVFSAIVCDEPTFVQLAP